MLLLWLDGLWWLILHKMNFLAIFGRFGDLLVLGLVFGYSGFSGFSFVFRLVAVGLFICYFGILGLGVFLVCRMDVFWSICVGIR